ncbi:MAG: transcriptional regulator, TetR family, partial [Nocardioides sp.]|nr:transcriptional regulator, TetR family [Nocardioides sp.]
MPAVRTPTTSPKRRVPRQERSRRRVEGLLDAAARLVVDQGVESLSTRDIAQAAGAPVASLYQYF